ncbi:MAG: hypothetical protein HYZ44_14820 [Bacteroidetes bacterium]|nr:hypothetical protein [Bacteroidota bacterium]
MKKTSKNIGVQTSNKAMDYFEYARKNPGKGKIISHSEAIIKVIEAKARKLKKAS